MKETAPSELNSIYLRPMQAADTENIVAWRNNPRVRHNFIYQGLFTPEGHLEWIRTKVETGQVVQFIICEKASGRSVGSVYLRDIDREKKWAEYGIFIGEDDAVGKGYGTQAAKDMISYAFGEMGLQFVYLRVFADNTGARKSYEKAGFSLLENRRDEVAAGGGVREVVFYGIKKCAGTESKEAGT